MAGQLITVSKQGSPVSSAQLQGTVTEGWVVTARAWATGSQSLRPSPILAREGKQGPGQILPSLRGGGIPRGSMLAGLGSSHS